MLPFIVLSYPTLRHVNININGDCNVVGVSLNYYLECIFKVAVITLIPMPRKLLLSPFPSNIVRLFLYFDSAVLRSVDYISPRSIYNFFMLVPFYIPACFLCCTQLSFYCAPGVFSLRLILFCHTKAKSAPHLDAAVTCGVELRLLFFT